MAQKVSEFDEQSKERIQEGNQLLSEAEEISRAHAVDKSSYLEKSKAEFLANSNKAIAASNARREELTSFFEHQQEEMKRFQAQVLAEVSTLLSSFVSERESAIKNSLQTANQGFTNSTHSMLYTSRQLTCRSYVQLS